MELAPALTTVRCLSRCGVQELEASVPRAQWSAGGRNIKLPSLTPADVVIKTIYGRTGMARMLTRFVPPFRSEIPPQSEKAERPISNRREGRGRCAGYRSSRTSLRCSAKNRSRRVPVYRITQSPTWAGSHAFLNATWSRCSKCSSTLQRQDHSARERHL
jgi:hypothetical protein